EPSGVSGLMAAWPPSAENLVQRARGEHPGGPGLQLADGGGVDDLAHRLGKLAELERQQLHQHLSTTTGLALSTTTGLALSTTFGAEHLCDGHVNLLRLRTNRGDQIVQPVAGCRITYRVYVSQQGRLTQHLTRPAAPARPSGTATAAVPGGRR